MSEESRQVRHWPQPRPETRVATGTGVRVATVARAALRTRWLRGIAGAACAPSGSGERAGAVVARRL